MGLWGKQGMEAGSDGEREWIETQWQHNRVSLVSQG